MTFYRACWGIARGLSAVLFRLRVEGREHIPRAGGLVVASNHSSYTDPVLIGVAIGRELLYVTKQEVFRVPVLAWLIRSLNALPIDRSRGDRSAISTVEKQLKAGRAVLVFPEGHRNKGGRFLEPKAGVGMLACRASVPVLPVYISGTVNVWKCLLGLSRVVVKFGPPVRFSPGKAVSRRREAYQFFSSEVMHKIGALRQGERNADPAAPASFHP